MRTAIVIAIVGLVLVAVMLFHYAPGVFGTSGSSQTPPQGKTTSRGSLAPEAVLAITPSMRSGAAAAPVRKMAPALQDFYDTKSYAALYARLSKATSRSGEEDWMLEQMLERCAKVADDESERSGRLKLGDPGARDRYIASLAPNDPDRDKRITAFDEVNFDKCGDLANVEITHKDLRALLESGAASGDPKARADLVRMQLDDQLRGPDGKFKSGPDNTPRITDSQVDTLKQAFMSGDPFAARTALSTLVFPYQNLSLRDSDDRPVNAQALYTAGILLGCDYGYPCGPDSPWLENGCAFSGNCDAQTLRDYILYYGSTPNVSQRIAGYEAALRNVMNNGDWSAFHFYPGPNPVTAAYQAPKSP